jgi:glycine/D-amino acid oxidase-like deaminating enzyme
MPATPRASFDASLWFSRGTPVPDLAPLRGASRADIAVVGGGILGLSLALHLAEAGARVALVEAEEAGFGASGRNTGFLVPAFPFAVGPDEAAAILGAERGEALSRMIGGGGELVLDLIARHAIACEAERTGWLTTAITPAKAEALAHRQQAWGRIGKQVELLDMAETRRLSGSNRYLAALLDRSGGQINPLAYVRGLATAAQRAGAAVHVANPATALESDGAGWRVTTPHGAVRADRVVLATNALVGRLCPPVARSLFPVTVHQVATEPLPEERLRTILPEGQCVTDTQRDQVAYRRTQDARIITGGPAAVPWGADRRLPPALLGKLAGIVPGAAGLRPAFVWSGVVAVTPDFLPRAFAPQPGLTALIGCNGRGIAMSTALGRAAARWLTTGDEQELPLRPQAPEPIPFHAVAQHGPRFWLPLARLRDWRDALAG